VNHIRWLLNRHPKITHLAEESKSRVTIQSKITHKYSISYAQIKSEIERPIEQPSTYNPKTL
jgi:hypothetical protein